MKFEISKENLLEGLKVGKSINGKSPLEALNGVYIEAAGDKIIFRGSDVDISIETSVVADVYVEGKLLVDYKIFSNIARKLPNDCITIDSGEGPEVNIICKKSHFKLIAMDCNEYPKFPKLDDEKTVSIKIPQSDLREAINKVYFAASLDDTRPILKGTLIEIENNKLNLAAMDGYRVSTASLYVDADKKVSAIPDTKHLVEVSRLLGSTGIVEIGFTDNKILFKMDNTTTICRLLEGSYVNYRSIISPFMDECKYKFDINRNEIISALERATLLSKGKDGRNLIKFKINENSETLNIVSRSTMGNSTEEVVITDSEGFTETFEIAFNSTYLSDILKHLGNEELTFYLNSNVNPCIIRGKGVSKDFETFLVLPVRINLAQ